MAICCTQAHPGDVDSASEAYWAGSQQACPRCGGTGVPVVLEITDEDTMEAVRTGLACLGECCFDGARGIDRECVSCSAQWNSARPEDIEVDA